MNKNKCLENMNNFYQRYKEDEALSVANDLLAKHNQDLNLDTKILKASFAKTIVSEVSKKDLLNILVRQTAALIKEEPHYSFLSARLLNEVIEEEVFSQSILSFSDSVAFGFEQKILNQDLYNFVMENKEAINPCIDHMQDKLFTYFGLCTVYDRYLLKNPITRLVFERPQYLFMRVACGIHKDVSKALDLYRLMSSFEYMPGSPTLFNSGTKNPQLSSCFLVDSPNDSIEGIYDRYKDVAFLSKHGGGIGISYSKVRSRGSLIRGTNGKSSGIIPWLKTLDSSVSAVNQGGRRKGACCVYLETWHADIESFLELRDNTGDESQRTHNLNIANWIPDLFMKRVEKDEMWSLFDPAKYPQLNETYGKEFEQIYLRAEEEKGYEKQISARDLYGRMMKTLAQTGNGWMVFKDSSNLKCNQTGYGKDIIHLSNLCTEILEVNSSNETSVCNIGSLNVSRYVSENGFDFEKLRKNVDIAIRQLNRTVDVTYYPISQARASNIKWRPVGIGMMGLQDVFFKLRIPFESSDAASLTKRISEEVYLQALSTSADLAQEEGRHENFENTKAAKGLLQPDLWPNASFDEERFRQIKEKIAQYGLRNSLLIAIAPTATIASIVGCYECIEPQISNIFKRETLSGEFLQINQYLVDDLKSMNLWNDEVKETIIEHNGSIQNIEAIPSSLKMLYKTAWEISQKSLIDLALARGPFVDQSQSLNLFMETPNIGKLSSMYFYAWQKGLKTCYYLRSRPATQISKTKKVFSEKEAVSCSLENPEVCEACT